MSREDMERMMAELFGPFDQSKAVAGWLTEGPVVSPEGERLRALESRRIAISVKRGESSVGPRLKANEVRRKARPA